MADAENLLQTPGPFLVDFYADWCEPCKWLEPILDEVAADMGERVQILKINIDEHPNFSKQMHILSVPTLVLFKQGKELWRMAGFKIAHELVKTIEEHI